MPVTRARFKHSPSVAAHGLAHHVVGLDATSPTIANILQRHSTHVLHFSPVSAISIAQSRPRVTWTGRSPSTSSGRSSVPRFKTEPDTRDKARLHRLLTWTSLRNRLARRGRVPSAPRQCPIGSRRGQAG